MTSATRFPRLSVPRIILLVLTASSLLVLALGCDFGPEDYKEFDIVNSLDEPVRLNITRVDLDESLPFDLARVFEKDPTRGWPNSKPRLHAVGELVTNTGTLIPSDLHQELYNKKVLVSAWADEGRVLFQAFIEWDQLFIGSDEIYTLVMTPQ